MMLEVIFVTPLFLKVRETLTRIGISSKTEETVSVLSHPAKRGRYFIVHFKELFLLDGKGSNLAENDIHRRNRIAKLLSDWGLVTLKNELSLKTGSMSQVKILPYKQKEEWTLVIKYSIGSSNYYLLVLPLYENLII